LGLEGLKEERSRLRAGGLLLGYVKMEGTQT
jgi:hypothetical protein